MEGAGSSPVVIASSIGVQRNAVSGLILSQGLSGSSVECPAKLRRVTLIGSAEGLSILWSGFDSHTRCQILVDFRERVR